jgi:putative intracellular protease/amidase
MSLKNSNVTNQAKRKRVAIVLSNPATSNTTGWPAGFWWSELMHPYDRFQEQGYETEVFSPNGGKCEAGGMSDPRDPTGYSASDLISMGFICTPSLAALVANTKKVADIDVQTFDAILVKHKTVTGFANVEEDFADNAVWSMNLLARDKHVTPWRIEDELKALGANYIQAGLWRGFAVRDGNLITGQQNFSGSETTETLVKALGE